MAKRVIEGQDKVFKDLLFNMGVDTSGFDMNSMMNNDDVRKGIYNEIRNLTGNTLTDEDFDHNFFEDVSDNVGQQVKPNVPQDVTADATEPRKPQPYISVDENVTGSYADPLNFPDATQQVIYKHGDGETNTATADSLKDTFANEVEAQKGISYEDNPYSPSVGAEDMRGIVAPIESSFETMKGGLNSILQSATPHAERGQLLELGSYQKSKKDAGYYNRPDGTFDEDEYKKDKAQGTDTYTDFDEYQRDADKNVAQNYVSSVKGGVDALIGGAMTFTPHGLGANYLFAGAEKIPGVNKIVQFAMQPVTKTVNGVDEAVNGYNPFTKNDYKNIDPESTAGELMSIMDIVAVVAGGGAIAKSKRVARYSEVIKGTYRDILNKNAEKSFVEGESINTIPETKVDAKLSEKENWDNYVNDLNNRYIEGEQLTPEELKTINITLDGVKTDILESKTDANADVIDNLVSGIDEQKNGLSVNESNYINEKYVQSLVDNKGRGVKLSPNEELILDAFNNGFSATESVEYSKLESKPDGNSIQSKEENPTENPTNSKSPIDNGGEKLIGILKDSLTPELVQIQKVAKDFGSLKTLVPKQKISLRQSYLNTLNSIKQFISDNFENPNYAESIKDAKKLIPEYEKQLSEINASIKQGGIDVKSLPKVDAKIEVTQEGIDANGNPISAIPIEPIQPETIPIETVPNETTQESSNTQQTEPTQVPVDTAVPSELDVKDSVDNTQKVEPQSTEQQSSYEQSLQPKVETLKVQDISLDPDRFQYKVEGRKKGGSTNSISKEVPYNKDLAGVISVWKDPKDGKSYVVNGHNRFNKALENNIEDINVQYIEAETAPQAKEVGALQNIADGKGTTYDAVNLFKNNPELTAEMLRERGIELKQGMARDGFNIANLATPLFDRYIKAEGNFGEKTASLVGKLPKDIQIEFYRKFIDGKPKLSEKVISEGVDIFLDSKGEVGTKNIGGLFGETVIDTDNITKRLELQVDFKDELTKTKNIFNKVKVNANAINNAVGTVDKALAGEIVFESRKYLDLFDRLKSGKNIQDVFRETINKINEVKSPRTAKGYARITDIKNEGFERIKAELDGELKGTDLELTKAVPKDEVSGGQEPQGNIVSFENTKKAIRDAVKESLDKNKGKLNDIGGVIGQGLELATNILVKAIPALLKDGVITFDRFVEYAKKDPRFDEFKGYLKVAFNNYVKNDTNGRYIDSYQDVNKKVVLDANGNPIPMLNSTSELVEVMMDEVKPNLKDFEAIKEGKRTPKQLERIKAREQASINAIASVKADTKLTIQEKREAVSKIRADKKEVKKLIQRSDIRKVAEQKISTSVNSLLNDAIKTKLPSSMVKKLTDYSRSLNRLISEKVIDRYQKEISGKKVNPMDSKGNLTPEQKHVVKLNDGIAKFVDFVNKTIGDSKFRERISNITDMQNKLSDLSKRKDIPLNLAKTMKKLSTTNIADVYTRFGEGGIGLGLGNYEKYASKIIESFNNPKLNDKGVYEYSDLYNNKEVEKFAEYNRAMDEISKKEDIIDRELKPDIEFDFENDKLMDKLSNSNTPEQNAKIYAQIEALDKKKAEKPTKFINSNMNYQEVKDRMVAFRRAKSEYKELNPNVKIIDVNGKDFETIFNDVLENPEKFYRKQKIKLSTDSADQIIDRQNVLKQIDTTGFTKGQMEQLKQLTDMDVSGMDISEGNILNRLINNVIYNGDFGGAGSFLNEQSGKKSLPKIASLVRALKLKTTKAGINSLTDIFVRKAGDHVKSSQLENAMRVNELSIANSRASQKMNKFSTGIRDWVHKNSKIYDKAGRNVMNRTNESFRGFLGALTSQDVRNSFDVSFKEETKQLLKDIELLDKKTDTGEYDGTIQEEQQLLGKKAVRDIIEPFMGEPKMFQDIFLSEHDIPTQYADYKAFVELKGMNPMDIANFTTFITDVDGVKMVQDMWKGDGYSHEQLKESANKVNQEIDDIKDYSSTKTNTVNGTEEIDATKDPFELNWGKPQIDGELSGNLQNRKGIKKNQYRDFNFFTNQMDAIYNTAYEIESRDARSHLSGIFSNSNEALSKTFGSKENANVLREKVKEVILEHQNKANQSKLYNTSEGIKDLLTNATKIAGQYGVKSALGSATQGLKQLVAPTFRSASEFGITNTVKAVRLFLDTSEQGKAIRSAVNEMIDLESSIPLRDDVFTQSTKGLEKTYPEFRMQEIDENAPETVKRKLSMLNDHIKKYGEFGLKFLKFGDKASAKIIYTSSFLDYLSKKGYDLKNITPDFFEKERFGSEKDDFNDAKTYANQSVDRLQSSSDSARTSDFLKNINSKDAARIITQLLAPFNSFNINKVSQMTNGVEKKKAWAGIVTEALVFNLVAQSLNIGTDTITNLASQLFGATDEDLKKIEGFSTKEFWTKYIGRTINDASPTSAGGVFNTQMLRFLDNRMEENNLITGKDGRAIRLFNTYKPEYFGENKEELLGQYKPIVKDYTDLAMLSRMIFDGQRVVKGGMRPQYEPFPFEKRPKEEQHLLLGMFAFKLSNIATSGAIPSDIQKFGNAQMNRINKDKSIIKGKDADVIKIQSVEK